MKKAFSLLLCLFSFVLACVYFSAPAMADDRMQTNNSNDSMSLCAQYGHNYVETIVSAATTKTYGEIRFVCSVCGEEYGNLFISSIKSIKPAHKEYKYTGKTITPKIDVITENGEKLKVNTDYVVTTNKKSINPGSYQCKVTFIGHYSGTKTFKYKIKKANAKYCYAKTDSAPIVYNGKNQKPRISVYTSAGVKLDTKQYKIIYPQNSAAVGEHQAKIQLKESRRFKKSHFYVKYTIVPKSTDFISLTKAYRCIRYTIKPIAGVSGYEIKYSRNKDFKNSKKLEVSAFGALNGKITKLNKNKEYYLKVRTYKKIGGKKFFSEWSEVCRKKTDGEYVKFTYPCPAFTTITMKYKGYRGHTGIDFGTKYFKNQKVVAAEDGEVVYVRSRRGGYGKYIIIRHSKSTRSGDVVYTLYAHNNKILVKVGDKVKRGQRIAKSGSTGNSDSPHVHFEVRVGGSNQLNAVNPQNFKFYKSKK